MLAVHAMTRSTTVSNGQKMNKNTGNGTIAEHKRGLGDEWWSWE